MSGKAFSIIPICFILAAIFMAQENPNDTKLLPIPVCLDGKSVFINKHGNIILKTSFDYDSFLYFSEKLARFKESGKWGFIDKREKIAIKPIFDSVSSFSEGLAAIWINDKAGVIDKTGKIIVQPLYDEVRDFRNGFAQVRVESGRDKYDLPKYKVGFIDRSGKIAIGKTNNENVGKFDDADDFSEGLAPVKFGDRWGYVNEKGETIIRFRFKNAKSFSEGLAPVTVNGEKWGFIDKTGNLVIKPQFTYADGFSEGLAAFSTNKSGFGDIGFINKSGNIVFKTPFFLVRKFQEGRADFALAGADKGSFIGGLIDKTGKIIFQEEKAVVVLLNNGVAIVNSDNQISYIDKAGKYIWNARERNKETSSKCNDLKSS